MRCPNCKIECFPGPTSGFTCSECNFTAPKNTQRIDLVYAFVACDQVGNEGIIAIQTPSGAMPMVFAEKRLMEKLKTTAQQCAQETGQKVYLLEFSTRKILEEIT